MKHETKHSPEPWTLQEYSHDGARKNALYFVRAGDDSQNADSDHVGGLIVNVGGLVRRSDPTREKQREEARANARRIVACVNACEGVPSDELTQGIVLIMQGTTNAAIEAMRKALGEEVK